MAVVIADASPLIALAKINQLDLLHRLFSTVQITRAVADECLRRPSTDAEQIANFTFFSEYAEYKPSSQYYFDGRVVGANSFAPCG